ncbi:hypothetical protein C9374_003177 [Naegleria lovaniensis]|uniref:Uncharacterized protein n=1 Tax=Naegleria lovaniensis TaxID=51637 RepID=A0AA88GTK7_NAELO|nr:uncharacterized protein C9374_003177 [Naegleria lovaniensis]KAG2386028.1 hypothetical protein C9374_003177 [Naegleria lovaniensis]
MRRRVQQSDFATLKFTLHFFYPTISAITDDQQQEDTTIKTTSYSSNMSQLQDESAFISEQLQQVHLEEDRVNNDNDDQIHSFPSTKRSELSFEEWRLVANFLLSRNAFQGLASVSRTARLAVLSCHFVQNVFVVRAVVRGWMEALHNSTSVSTLVPSDRLKSLLQPLHKYHLLDLTPFVHPNDKKKAELQQDNSSHESLVPVPNYYSSECVKYACEAGFTAMIDQLLEKPFLLRFHAPDLKNFLKAAFTNNHDDIAKKIIKFFVKRLVLELETKSSRETKSNLNFQIILTLCCESSTANVNEFYSLLEKELVAIFSSAQIDTILSKSILPIISEGHLVKFLKRNDFANALFVLRKFFTLMQIHDVETVFDKMYITFSVTFSQHGINAEQMIWLFDNIYDLSKANTLISKVVHRYIQKKSELYYEYLTRFKHRDVMTDKKLFEESLAYLTAYYWNNVFSVIQPSFSAFIQALKVCDYPADMLLQRYEPWLSKNYPDELAEYLYENISILEDSNAHHAQHCMDMQNLFDSRMQQKLASVFLSKQQFDFEKLMYILQKYDCFSDLLSTILETSYRDIVLHQIYSNIISKISKTKNLRMMNDFLPTNEVDMQQMTNNVYYTAAVLMYCAKFGNRNLFECIVDQQKDVISQFPQELPVVYNTIADMANIQPVSLRKEFHLISYSTEILLFIIRHEILRKYLNVLASLSSLPVSVLEFHQNSIGFVDDSPNQQPDMHAVLKEYALSDKDISELISLYISRNVMAQLSNLLHFPSFTSDHLLEIPEAYLFNSITLGKLTDLHRVVDLLMENFEQERIKNKFKEFFCFIHGKQYSFLENSRVVQCYSKYMKMVEEIMYDLLFDEKYFHAVSSFHNGLNDDTCTGESSTKLQGTLFKMQDKYALKRSKKVKTEAKVLVFKLSDHERLLRALKSKLEPQQPLSIKFEHYLMWKSFIQQVSEPEILDQVNQLLAEIEPETQRQSTNFQPSFSTQTLSNPFQISFGSSTGSSISSSISDCGFTVKRLKKR